MNSKAIIGFEGDEFYSRNAVELGLAGKTSRSGKDMGTFWKNHSTFHFPTWEFLFGKHILISVYAAVQDSGRVSEKWCYMMLLYTDVETLWNTCGRTDRKHLSGATWRCPLASVTARVPRNTVIFHDVFMIFYFMICVFFLVRKNDLMLGESWWRCLQHQSRKVLQDQEGWMTSPAQLGVVLLMLPPWQDDEIILIAEEHPSCVFLKYWHFWHFYQKKTGWSLRPTSS